MTEEDFDEDVISKNSPLYQYMDEVGMEREDANEENSEAPHSKQQKSPTNPQEPQEASWQFFQSKSMCNKLWLHYVSKHMRSFHAIALKAPLLFEDDRQTIAFLSHSWPTAPVTFDVMRFLLRKSLSASVLFLCLAWTALLSWAVAAFVAVLLLVLLVVAFRLRSSHRQVTGATHALSTLSAEAQRLDTQARKTVLFIQEAEVVARGFTFVSVRGVINNVEASRNRSQRECPHLRKVLFFALRHCVRLLRSQGRQLVLDLPEIRQHDAQHCLSDLDEKEYGECFSEMDEEKAKRLTDHFSIPSLRAMHQLYALHLSEIIRLLTLAAYVIVQQAPLNVLDFYPFEFLHRIETLLVRHLAQVAVELERHLETHKRAAMGAPDEEEEQEIKERRDPSGAETALHSLTLHMQAALRKSRALEQVLPSADPKRSAADLQAIGAELSACSACLDETSRRLFALKDPNCPQKDSEGLPPESEPKSVPEPSTEIAAAPAEEYVIRDEVLEAFVESDLSEEEDHGFWLEDGTFVASREEAKALRQKEKEESQQLLSELKAVIAVRARNWAKRERRALRRHRRGSNAQGDTESSPEESDCESATERGDGKIEEKGEERSGEKGSEEPELRRRQPFREGDGDVEAAVASGPPLGIASALAAAAISHRGALGAGMGGEEQFGDSSCSEED